MASWTLASAVVLALCTTHASGLLQSPPRIVKQPPSDELPYKVAQSGEEDKPFFIECEAEGEPAPNYYWIKNGKKFEYQSYDNRISQQPGRGTLVVNSPRDEDEGQYQCFAKNELGTATSNSVFVRKTILSSFREQPTKTIEAKEGEPFKLTCQPPDGWPKPDVYWMLQGDRQIKTINNSRQTLDPEGNLFFSNVTREDASDLDENKNFAYTCAAKSAWRSEYKLGNKVFLRVLSTGISAAQNQHEPVLQYVSRRNEVASRGKKAELYCIFGGTPLPQIVWSKNGVQISTTDRITLGNYGKSLIIKRVTDDDAGEYTCEASNGVGTAKSNTVNLKIESAPYFEVEPQLKNAAEGETVEIRCEASGQPTPQIKWIYNGKSIEEAPYNERRIVTDNSIIIKDLVKKDTGNYGCNATNSIGYVYKDVYVNVQSLPPEITEAPGDITTVDGKTAHLKCRVFGAPKPVVTWILGDRELTGGRYNVTEDGDLLIRDVSFQDIGQYTCHASNKFDNVTAKGSLNVKKHTVITQKPEDYEVAAGSGATFRCNAIADDSLNLEIEWLKGDVPLELESQQRFVQGSDNSLHISSTTELDSGIYTCVARTELDETRAQATLIVEDVPNPPKLSGVECRDRTAQLHWAAQGDQRAPILSFSIQYNTSFTPDTWVTEYDQVPSVDSTYTIHMSPWANYTFRVKARNKIGESFPSGHSDVCTTAPDVPYKNPDHVEGKGTEPNNMVISWAPMPQIEHNAPGFHYRVSWRRNVTGQEWNHEEIFDWTQSQYVIPNQPTFQPYKIKVVAVNSKGESNVQPIEVTGWSGEDSPLLAPSNFTLVQITSPTNALLSWDPVPLESVRGHFNGYKIQTWTNKDDVKEIDVKPEAKNALVTNFVPYTTNHARILVWNGRYRGPPSEKLVLVMPEGKPGTVKSFEAIPIASSAMILKWEKPEHPNGKLIGYKVYYREMKGTQLGSLEERKSVIDPKWDVAKLAGLKPNTKYRIYIRALTKYEEGEEFFVEQTTKSAVSAQPDIPTFEAKTIPAQLSGQANILVRWLPSLDGHSGTHFQVKYRIKGEPRWLTTDAVLYEDWTVLHDVRAGELYELRLVAWDGDYFRESESQLVDTTIDGPMIVKETVASAGWFIGVMLALAFLLLVLLLVCVVRRNRGGKYDVHDRELAAGRRDYDEGGFHEYTHPLETKSRHSMGSGKPGPESDTDSMAEFGEGETAGMNEDGSFIGQYGRKRRPPRDGQTDSGSGAFATLV